MEPILPDSHLAIMAGIKAAVLMPVWLLGPGCGSILTLASHNRFRQDTEKQTYWVAITFIIITQMGSLCTRIAMDHFEGKLVQSSYISCRFKNVVDIFSLQIT